MYLTLKVLGSNPRFYTFFDQLSAPSGGGGGGPMWKRRKVAGPRGEGMPVGVGADHHGNELIMYCVYEYKNTKY
jgi:hypothetical protein